MYAEYWGLTESPFVGPADAHWFYDSPIHEEALARLRYLVDERIGCGLLVGPAGCGKSLLLDLLRERRGRGGRRSVFLDATGIDGRELLWSLAARFGLFPNDDTTEFVLWHMLRDHLAGLSMAGVPVIMAFDDADRATPEGLRWIERLLAETRRADDLTIVLASRSEDSARLPRALVEQCALRIELTPLDQESTARFVLESLFRAGAGYALFDEAALVAVHERTGGVPRLIRRLCDLALLAGMSETLEVIDADVVHAAADELDGHTRGSSRRRPVGSRW